MDARRYLARELKKRGFTFTQMKEASPCFTGHESPKGVTYTGWRAQFDYQSNIGERTQLVHVIDSSFPSLVDPDTKYVQRVISLDNSGKTDRSGHLCYQVCSDVGSYYYACQRNTFSNLFRDASPETILLWLEVKEPMVMPRPTQTLVQLALDYVDRSIRAAK